jgi:hypothetical protein
MPSLSNLELDILDAMVDDPEDVEQVYLAVNRERFEENPLTPSSRCGM